MDEYLRGLYSAYNHMGEMLEMFLQINDLKKQNELLKETDPEIRERILTHYEARDNAFRVVKELINDHIGNTTNDK